MNLFKKAVAASAAFLLVTSPVVAATDTDNLLVSATVAGNCTITGGTLAFGAYDPIVANASTALDGSTTISVACTSGTSAAITLGQGSNPDTGSTDAAPLRRMNSAGSFLSYALYQDSSRSVVWGNTAATSVAHTGVGTSSALTVYGRVAAGQNVPAGTYGDTVIATVTF